jgi:UDP-glucose 4-epimerase
MSHRILVTGGAGAIGSTLVNRLLEDPDNDIIVLDDLSSGHLENLPVSTRIRFIQGRVDSEEDLDRVFEAPVEDIYHLAANFANQNSVDFPQRDLQVNGMGTLKLLQRATKHKLRRLVYASSSCVYGHRVEPLSETLREFSLDTPYAITKLLGEHYMHFFHRHHGLPIVILRFFNVYGPNERPGRYRNVIANFLFKAMRGETITITGTGEETRDFNFVEDTVRAILMAARSESSVGHVFNIASGRETKILDMVRMILDITGSHSRTVFAPKRDWDSVFRRVASVDKAREFLGFQAEISLEEGLARYRDWLIQQDERTFAW